MTEREKKLRQRRKHAEELLAWKKKLDDEELRVREIEKQANQVLKKKSKQSPTKNEKKTKSEDQEADLDAVEEDVSADVVKTESKVAPVSTRTIATSINENSYAESFDSSTISTVQEIKSKNLTKKSRDDSQSNLMPASILNSIPTQLNNSGSKSDTRDDDTAKDSSSSSFSELTGPTPPSSTSSSVRELEQKVKELKNEYLKKKNEAEKLGKMLKETEKIKIREKEEQLRKKIQSYDHKLEKIKSALSQKDKQKLEKQEETSDDAKSSSTSTKPAYEDDFESEKASKHSQAHTKIEDDQKSTASEISEDLMENGASHSHMKLDGLEDGEENSASLNSSTDTQILILGSSRQAKDKEQSEREIEKFGQQDMAIQAFLNSCLDQAIDQMIELKNSKNSKLIAEQYRETMEELDAAGSGEETSDDEHMSDELMSTVKIPIPPIDLDQDFEEDGKQKKATDGVDESAKPVVLNVPFEREKVSLLVDQAIHNYYWKHLASLQTLLETNSANEASNLYDEQSLEEFFKPEAQFKESELSFKKMVLDLTGELMYDLYLEKFEQADVVSEYLPGHLRPLRKKHFRSYLRGPGDLAKVKELVGRKVLDLFKLGPEKENRDKARSKWRIQKKLDLVDGLLDVEMREQEHEWSNYEIEEYEAKLLISNSVFDLVLKDTIYCVQSTLIKKNSM
ncbi:hypothetical protein BpHYR1_018258 [Brachionus plicatilis]|uniref:DUF4378 domain-containing protein n=1 Tax=Brachionus plicatilis TaxID=10195 RepID=A0A3M7RWI6_BRAPC|nr:hypothetical protein BpHYR1_018258 [Brachionus plicatilis]